jgi:hypothetical protein
MLKIIDGKRYNTATATLIGEHESPLPQTDFGYFSEALYVTKKGTYFLAGAGHARTHWSSSLGNDTYGWGEGIRILDASEALDWCEQFGVEPDVIEAHFDIGQ